MASESSELSGRIFTPWRVPLPISPRLSWTRCGTRGRSLPPRGLPGELSPSPEVRGPPSRRAAPATRAQSPRGRRSRHGRGSGSCGDAPGRGYRRLLLQRHSGLGSSAPVRKLPPEPRLMTNLSQKLSLLLALPGGLSH